ERGAPHDDHDHDERDRRDDHGHRQAEEEPRADRLERRARRRRDLALRDEHRDAPARDHEDHRRDEGLDAQHRDHEPVERTEHERDRDAEQDRDDRGRGLVGGRAVVEELQGHRERDRHDGPDRQVDPARRDHERHAEREQQGCRGAAHDVDDLAEQVPVLDGHAQEAGAAHTCGEQQHEEGHDGPEQLVVHDAACELGGGGHATAPFSGVWAIRSTSTWDVSSGPLTSSSATTRSRTMRTRSLTRSTSSNSEEMNSTDIPRSASSITSRWTSAFAPTSIPRVGSSSTSTLGEVASHRASRTFCWFPPERFLSSMAGLRGWMLSASMKRSTISSISFLGTRRHTPRTVCTASAMFSRTVRSPMMPSRLRSSEENATWWRSAALGWGSRT